VEQPGDKPVLVTNLPFGERLGGKNALQLDGFYRTLGRHLSTWHGARVAIFTGHVDGEFLLGLERHAHRTRRFMLMSGALQAVLVRYDMKWAEGTDVKPAAH
jgi:23S rRNA G2445 N2-methylase RlmL